MNNVVITGGSRGLGFEFTKQYLKKGFQVFTASRHSNSTPKLQQLKEANGDLLTIYELDVSNEESRKKFFDKISEETEKIDILINNAGIASGNEKIRYRFGELDQKDLSRCFLVNAIAPLMVIEILFPLLKKGKEPKIINISSISGSISEKKGNGSTGYGYSSSKAALNMITKMLSIELKKYGIIVVSFHPGWVKTTMLYTENAPLEPFESINGMISIIDNLELTNTGCFFDWQGNTTPW